MFDRNSRVVRAIVLIAAGFIGLSCSAAPDRVTEQVVIGKVPVLVSRPQSMDSHTGLVLLYHGFGSPASPSQLAAALPLLETNVVAAYVNLPLIADRLPQGGMEELIRIQRTDFVNGLFYRSIAGAVAEMPGLASALTQRYRLDSSSGIGLFGFSAGGSAVLLALMDSALPISAAVVMNAPFSVRQNVTSWERALNREYQWDDDSRRAADHFDVQKHADQIASRTPHPAILVLQSTSDEHLELKPAVQAFAAIKQAYLSAGLRADLEFHALENGKHNFGPDDTQIANAAADWFRLHMFVK